MEKNDNIFPSKEVNPKNNSEFKFLKKKRKETKNYGILIKNPKINYFNDSSHFIYDKNDSLDYFNSLNQKNQIKLNDEEILLLQKNIEEIELKKSINKGEIFVELSKDLFDSLNSFKPIKKPETQIEKYIKEKINNSNNRSQITTRKLAKIYYDETGKKISKSTIHNIIKNKLGYSYLKTTYKNNYLRSKNAIILCLCFIKIFVRLMKFNYEIIFIDESKVEAINSHLRCWRKRDETIYFGSGQKNKVNLIMAVGKNKVYKIEINQENTNSNNYLMFIKDLYCQLEKDKDKKYAIICDNLKAHKTKQVMDYFIEKKINVVFNVAYQSSFNAIELCFRAIKKITYTNIFNSIEDIKKKINDIIEAQNFNETLLYNFKETLKIYLYYEQTYKYENFNSY